MRNIRLAHVSEPDRKAAMPSDATSTTPISPAIEARVLSITVPSHDIVPSIVIVCAVCQLQLTSTRVTSPSPQVLKRWIEYCYADQYIDPLQFFPVVTRAIPEQSCPMSARTAMPDA
jgi:hypothetical protein